jgi:uracil-DNA glycosylase family 4
LSPAAGTAGWCGGQLLHPGLLACDRCPRLASFRAQADAVRAPGRLRGADYWARPVPLFGDPQARLLLVGMAPGFHGANRTGIPFCGDVSGRLIYGALHRLGAASHPDPELAGADLELRGVAISNAVKCVPPGNAPLPGERHTCRDWLAADLTHLASLRAIVALGHVAHDALLDLAGQHTAIRRADHRFAHGTVHRLDGLGVPVLDSFHPSPLNSNRGIISADLLAELLRPLLDPP